MPDRLRRCSPNRWTGSSSRPISPPWRRDRWRTAWPADLRLLADQESRGGGGVFRFSAASMRRAFDAGWSADDVHRWLAEHSSTGVPQPLQYLVDDVARRHGSIRVGPAGSYLRVGRRGPGCGCC